MSNKQNNIVSRCFREFGALWGEMVRLGWWEFIVLCCLLLLYVFFQVFGGDDQAHVWLGKAFLSGQLHFRPEDIAQWAKLDMAIYEGRYYWPSGPLPGVLMMPLILVFKNPDQYIIRTLLNLANLTLAYVLVRRVWDLPRRVHALWFALGFVVGTAYFVDSILPAAMIFAQVMAMTLMLLTLIEYHGKRRWWLLGLGVVGMGLTRPTLWLGAVLFGLLWIQGFRQKKTSKRDIYWFMLMIGFGIITVLLYNFLRFGSLFESGYGYQLTPSLAVPLLTHGLFHWHYLPANLYYFLLAAPKLVTDSSGIHAAFPYLMDDRWGISIFITSPIFLFSLRNLRRRELLPYWVGLVVILLPTLFFYGIGHLQYGYRYALDIYPILLILTVLYFPLRLMKWAKILILTGFVLAIWVGMFSIINP